MRIRSFLPALLMLVMPVCAQAGVLRVCADPSNLPFSNRSGQGFENRIAEVVARDMGDTVAYTYALQNDNFVKHTLNAGTCDVMMGVSVGMDDVLTTQPYYASTYVFVSRKADDLKLASITDPRLRKLKIGVHLIGDDSTPPAMALGQEGIVDNVTGYMIYGDFSKPNPPARVIEAVEKKDVDVAAVWGPLGGYFAKSSAVPLSITPMTNTAQFKPLIFRYAIAMGVKKGNTVLRDRLDAIIAREQPAIRRILLSYGVPLVNLNGASHG